MRSYLQTLITTFVILALVSIGFSWYAIQNNLLGFTYTELANYQLNKIKDAPPLDIAVVGDSSGGNAINSQLLGEQLNLNAISLSLTGTFGYGGSYIMARHAIQKGAKTIVLVHTMDMLTRPLYQDHRASIFLIRSLSDLLELTSNLHHVLSLYLSRDIVATAIKQTFKALTKRKVEYSPPLSSDYIQQSSPIDASGIRYDLSKKMIKPEKLYYLQQLSLVCKSNNIDCFYAYGPIHHSFCKNNQDYIEHSNQLIQSSGIKLLTTQPYCMENHEIGDSEDHILPSYKPLSTRHYANLIADMKSEI